MEIRDIALWLGLVLGTLLITITCVVYLREKQFGSGLALVAAGVALIGMSVWNATTIKVGGDGIEIITQVREDVSQLAEANKTVSEELTKVARRQELAAKASDEIADAVKAQVPAAAPKIESSERILRQAPSIDTAKLEVLRKGIQLRSLAH